MKKLISFALLICMLVTITPVFAEKAKIIARNRMLLAKRDPEYFKTQYKKDLSRKKLYADTEKH